MPLSNLIALEIQARISKERECGKNMNDTQTVNKVIEQDNQEWQAFDAEVWMHGKRLYCWACSSYTCEHVQATLDLVARVEKIRTEPEPELCETADVWGYDGDGWD